MRPPMLDEPKGSAPQKMHRVFVEARQADDGRFGFWLTCDRPFDEAATALLRSALRAHKAVPVVQHALSV